MSHHHSEVLSLYLLPRGSTAWLPILKCPQHRLPPDLGHFALKTLPRHGVDRDIGFLTIFTITMSVSSTLTSAVTTDMSERASRSCRLSSEFPAPHNAYALRQ